MSKRRTFKEVEAAARKSERDSVIGEVCRVLKHHMGQEKIADKLWAEMSSPGPKRQTWSSGPCDEHRAASS